MFTVSLLAVVLPISLLATFRLTGILPEPPTLETISVEAVYWGMERPSGQVVITDEVQNSYIEDKATAVMNIEIFEYFENDPVSPFFDRDGFILGLHVNASVTKGFIASITVRYCPMDANATVYVSENVWALILSNATVTKMRKIGTSGNEAYVVAKVSNLSCYLETQAFWVFNDENLEDHQLKVIIEIVYFNGTAYQKIVAPTHLLVWPDAGDTFESAKRISSGVCRGSLCQTTDPDDYYTISVEEGQIINVQMTPPFAKENFDLYLYDPNRELKADSCSGKGFPERISFKADSAGLWYIQLHCSPSGPRGLYSLNVTILSSEGSGH